jgi:hypothetical protein
LHDGVIDAVLIANWGREQNEWATKETGHV